MNWQGRTRPTQRYLEQLEQLELQLMEENEKI